MCPYNLMVFFSVPLINSVYCCTYSEPEEGVVFEGNQRFEGYSFDLIDAISKILVSFIFHIFQQKLNSFCDFHSLCLEFPLSF